MAAIWCPECNRYVSSAKPCMHTGIAVNSYTTSVSAVVHKGDGAVGPGDAERQARDGDASLEGASQTSIPDGLDAEHAEHLIGSGDARSGDDGHAHGQRALSEEMFAVLKRVITQHPLSGFDVAGVLFSLAHDYLHVSKCRDCGNCVERGDDDDS